MVGGKNFTEQQIMAEMTTQLLKAKGFTVDKRAGLGTAPLRQAQEAGQIDVYWEYTGTSLITFNKVTEKLDAAATYAKVKELDAAKGLVWLNPSKANNTYALAMRKADAAAKGITSLSDLAAKVKGGQALKFGCNAEFYARPDGLAPLQKTYGFEFGRESTVRMDTGLIYQALARFPGRCRARFRHRRACSGLRLRHPDRRQGLFPDLCDDARRPQGGPRQEPEARRGAERALREARRQHHGQAQRLGRCRQEERRGGGRELPQGAGAGLNLSTAEASGLRHIAGAAMSRLKVAAAQIECRPGDIPANLAAHLAMIGTARDLGVDLLVFPELSLTDYLAEPDNASLALDPADPTLALLAEAAFPTWRFRSASSSAMRAGRHFNAQALLADRKVAGIHRKLNLPGYGRLREDRAYTPGESLALTPLAAGWQAATLICADSWNPALPWLAALTGANLLIMPAASSRDAVGDDFDNARGWDINLTHTALTYGLPTIFANHCGRRGGFDFWGGSRILDASGRELARAGAGPELIVAELDLADGQAARAGLANHSRQRPGPRAAPARDIPLSAPGTLNRCRRSPSSMTCASPICRRRSCIRRRRCLLDLIGVAASGRRPSSRASSMASPSGRWARARAARG